MKRFRRALYISASTCIAICLLTVGFLPQIVSTNWGKGMLIRLINNQTKGDLEIGSMHLSWFRGQKIKDVNFRKKGEHSFFLKSIESDCSFFTLIFQTGNIGITTVDQMRLTFQEKVDAQTKSPPLDLKKKPPFKKSTHKKWSQWSGTLSVKEGEITLQKEGREDLSIKHISMNLTLPSNTFPLSIQAKGITKERSYQGHFDIDLQLEPKTVIGYARVENFPIEGLDRLLSLANGRRKHVLMDSIGSNLSVNFVSKGSPEAIETTLNISSTRLKAQIDALFNKEVITLKNPAEVTWEMSPTLFHTLMEFSNLDIPLQLFTDGKVEIHLQKGKIALDNKGLSSSHFLANGAIKLSHMKWLLLGVNQKFFLDDFSLKFDKNTFEEDLKVTFKNGIYFETYPSATVEGECLYAPFLKAKTPAELLPYLDLNIQRFPIAFFSKNTPIITSLLGESLNCRISKEKKSLFVEAKTPFFSLKKSQFQVDETIHLIHPTFFKLSLQPSFYAMLSHPVEIEGHLEKLTLPFSRLKKENIEPFFDIKLKAPRAELLDPFLKEPVQVIDSHLTLDGKGFSSVNFSGEGVLQFIPSTWGHLIAGQSLKTTISGQLNLDNRLEIKPFNLNIKGSELSASLTAAITESGIVLKKPLRAKFWLTPEKINPFLIKNSDFLLSKKVPIHLEVKEANLEFNQNQTVQKMFKVKCLINSLEATDARSHSPTVFDQIQVNLDVNEKEKRSALEVKAKIGKEAQGTIAFSLESDGLLRDLLEKPSKIVANLSDLSSELLDRAFKLNGQARAIIGPDFSLKYEMKEDKKAFKNIDLNFRSEKLKAKGFFQVSDKELTLKSSKDPLVIDWKGSKEFWNVFASLQKKNLFKKEVSFKGVGDFSLKAKATELTLPVKEKGRWVPQFDFNPYLSLFEIGLVLQDLKLSDKHSKILSELKELDLNLSKPRKGGDLSFDMSGEVSDLEQGKDLAIIDFKGDFKQVFTPDGSIDFKNLSTSIKGNVSHLPSIYLDALMSFSIDSDFLPSTVFGTFFNARVDGEIEKAKGHFNLAVKASALEANISSVIRDGMVFLNRPLIAKMKITEKFTHTLAANAKMTVIPKDEPITVEISPRGFYIPFKDFQLKKANFSYARIDLGKLYFQNSGNVREMSDIFKIDSSRGATTSIWAAPMEMRMRDGLMYIERTEILYNNAYEVAIWGDINFKTRYVDMILGLTAQSLRAAFGIRKLDPDYVLKVPIEGPFGEAEVNKKVAISKIALLIGQKHLVPQNSIWGGILGAVGKALDNQSDVPKAKPPFPWQ